jgi:hypothetical protein
MNDTTLTVSVPASKKEVRKMVYEKLAASLAEYKENLKEKTFTRNLKKVSKLFAADIARTIGKKTKHKKAKKQEMKPVNEPKKEVV